MSPEQILSRWGSDDMFYYTQIAGHFFESGKLSFDGINPGSGVQPLFFLLLVPFGKWILNDYETAIKVLFILITLLNTGTAFLLKKGISKLTNKPLHGVIVASIFLIHPKIISVCYQGTEAALSFLVLTAIFIGWHQLLLKKKILTASLIFSLGVLTRFDYCFLLLGMGVISLFLKQVSLLNLIKSGILPLFSMLLWMLFLYYQTGHYQPDSGVAKQLHANYLFDSTNNILENRWLTSIQNYFRAFVLPFRAEQNLSITTFILLGFGGYFSIKSIKRTELFFSLKKYLFYMET